MQKTTQWATVMLETRDAPYARGYAPAYTCDIGRLNTSLAFAEIKQRSERPGKFPS